MVKRLLNFLCPLHADVYVYHRGFSETKISLPNPSLTHPMDGPRVQTFTSWETKI